METKTQKPPEENTSSSVLNGSTTIEPKFADEHSRPNSEELKDHPKKKSTIYFLLIE